MAAFAEPWHRTLTCQGLHLMARISWGLEMRSAADQGSNPGACAAQISLPGHRNRIFCLRLKPADRSSMASLWKLRTSPHVCFSFMVRVSGRICPTYEPAVLQNSQSATLVESNESLDIASPHTDTKTRLFRSACAAQASMRRHPVQHVQLSQTKLLRSHSSCSSHAQRVPLNPKPETKNPKP